VSYTYYKTGDASNPFDRIRAGITIKDQYIDAQTTPVEAHKCRCGKENRIEPIPKP